MSQYTLLIEWNMYLIFKILLNLARFICVNLSWSFKLRISIESNYNIDVCLCSSYLLTGNTGHKIIFASWYLNINVYYWLTRNTLKIGSILYLIGLNLLLNVRNNHCFLYYIGEIVIANTFLNEKKKKVLTAWKIAFLYHWRWKDF